MWQPRGLPPEMQGWSQAGGTGWRDQAVSLRDTKEADVMGSGEELMEPESRRGCGQFGGWC